MLALQRVVGNQALVPWLAAGSGGASSSSLAVQRDTDTPGPSWTTLSAPLRAQAEELYDDCDDSIGVLDEAQMVRVSPTRASWLTTLRKIRARIEAVDDERQLVGVRNAYRDYDKGINRVVVEARTEWDALEKRYLDERRWLLSARVRSTDSLEAAKYLDDVYGQTKPTVPLLVTDDDFAGLKRAMDRQEYVRIGALRGARIRAEQLQELMRTVADLTRRGEDAAKFIPEWQQRVQEEAAYLETFAALAASQGRDYAKELTELRSDLLRRRQETEAVKPPERSVLGKGAALVEGAVEAVVGIFVEAAKQVVDLVQINLHFLSLGRYEPRFISDLAKAAEQGATTTDLLKGMVMGMIETPERFLKACRDGDWEAIGRESVNLYLLAKTLKEAPETARRAAKAASRLPELLAKTNESLRILRQRTVSLGLKNEGRLVPEPAPSRPGPRLTVEQGGGQGTGRPTGTLRDTDAPGRGVGVDASHPVLKGKAPANENAPRPPQPAEAVKVAVNGPRDVPPGKPLEQRPGTGGDRPSMTRKPPEQDPVPAEKGTAEQPERSSKPEREAEPQQNRVAAPEYFPGSNKVWRGPTPDIGVIEIRADGSMHSVYANRQTVAAQTGTNSHIALANAPATGGAFDGLGPAPAGAQRYRVYLDGAGKATSVQPLSRGVQTPELARALKQAIQANRRASPSSTIIDLSEGKNRPDLKLVF